jgi:hypothetical protein
MRPSLASLPVDQRGQASIEYLIVAMSVVIALVAISIAGRQHCVESFGGELGSADCDSIHSAVGAALTRTVEEVTFLINLPF